MDLETVYPIAPSEVRPDVVGVRWSGDFRPPLAGEWFLSGSDVEAYKATAALATSYHIAEPVIYRARWFVGVKGGNKEVFHVSSLFPWEEWRDRYDAVHGPFRVREAAEYALLDVEV